MSGMHCEGFETGQVPVQPSSTVDEGWSMDDRREAERAAQKRFGEVHDDFADGAIYGFILGAEWQNARTVVEAIGGERSGDRDDV